MPSTRPASGPAHPAQNNNVVRAVAAGTQIMSTFAGSGTPGYAGDGAAATNALMSPTTVAVDASGNVFFTDFTWNVVRRVDAVSRIITTYAGIGGGCCWSGDGVPATSSYLHQPYGIAIDGPGNVFIADSVSVGPAGDWNSGLAQ